MVVGLLRLTLHIPEAHSLKDRRAVVRRAVERVRARFNVTIAEVGDLDRWQIATVAAAVVSNDRSLVNEILDKVTGTIASAAAGSAIIASREMEIQSYGDHEPIGEGLALKPSGIPPMSMLSEDDDADDET
jgi:uncharacterized protein YlxP (DUF503 family)